MARCCSLRCCGLAVPVLAFLAYVGFGAIAYGRVLDWIPGWRPVDMPDLKGKVAIVTGPTLNGIGFESALEMARKGAHVILAGRSKSKGEEALKVLKAELPNAKAEFMELDLSSFANVKKFAESFIARKLPLHILLNNAGVMMNPFQLTVDGLESQFATNHLGHYLLTRLLVPVLEQSAPARVVHVSSAAAYFPDLYAFIGRVAGPQYAPKGVDRPLNFTEHLGADHRANYHEGVAYGRSKLANLLFARALDRRLHSKKIFSNALNPGGIKTNLGRHMEASMRLTNGEFALQMFEQFKNNVLLTPKQGAVTQLYLCTSPDVEKLDIHGKFYRPQATEATLPPSVSEALEEHLWEVSEALVKKYL